MTREQRIEEAARRAVAEYRADLKAGRWSDVLLEAMDELRLALSASVDDARGGKER